MKKNRQSGMSLIELFIAITVLGLLIGLSIPSFLEFVAENRLTNASNDLNAAIQYARSEAVKSGRRTTVAAADCGSGADWTGGAFVWVDLDGDGSRDGGELLRGDPAPAECPSEYEVAAAGGSTAIVLGADGRANAAETFSFCDKTQAVIDGRELELSLSGHLSRNGSYTGC